MWKEMGHQREKQSWESLLWPSGDVGCVCVGGCVRTNIFAPDLMFHLSHWPGGPVTSGGKRHACWQGNFKCDNAGHWSIVGVMATKSLTKPADELWLKGCYSSRGTYTVDSLFEHGIAVLMICFEKTWEWEYFQSGVSEKDERKEKTADKGTKISQCLSLLLILTSRYWAYWLTRCAPCCAVALQRLWHKKLSANAPMCLCASVICLCVCAPACRG